MPGIMLYIPDIAQSITCHDVANVIEYAGFGEIYGVQFTYENDKKNAIVELVCWDCEENEWLINIIDDLREGYTIDIPHYINGVHGTWKAVRFVEIEIPSNDTTVFADLEESSNDILNYSISDIFTDNAVIYNIDDEDDAVSIISSIRTVSYDDEHYVRISDAYDFNDFDEITRIQDWQTVDENNDLNDSYQYYRSLYGNITHPPRRFILTA